tara:strand:- start:4269 stop:4799 length:531 start_codon:yes stop_codon:yes gene_type:complete
MKPSLLVLYRLARRLTASDVWKVPNYRLYNHNKSNTGSFVKDSRAYRRSGGSTDTTQNATQKAISYLSSNINEIADFCFQAKMARAGKAVRALNRSPSSGSRFKPFIDLSVGFYEQTIEWYLNMTLRLQADRRLKVVYKNQHFFILQDNNPFLKIKSNELPPEDELLAKVESNLPK